MTTHWRERASEGETLQGVAVTQQASALLVAVEEALSQAVHAAPRRPLAARVLICGHPPHGLVHLVAPAASVEGRGGEGRGGGTFNSLAV